MILYPGRLMRLTWISVTLTFLVEETERNER